VWGCSDAETTDLGGLSGEESQQSVSVGREQRVILVGERDPVVAAERSDVDAHAIALGGYVEQFAVSRVVEVRRDQHRRVLRGERLDDQEEDGNTTFDASQTLTPFLTEGGIYNYTTSEMEEFKQQWQTETDPDQREQILQDANQLAHDDAVWVFLNREWLVYGINERIDWDPRQDEYFLAQGMSRS
jgi:hypothetical protein